MIKEEKKLIEIVISVVNPWCSSLFILLDLLPDFLLVHRLLRWAWKDELSRFLLDDRNLLHNKKCILMTKKYQMLALIYQSRRFTFWLSLWIQYGTTWRVIHIFARSEVSSRQANHPSHTTQKGLRTWDRLGIHHRMILHKALSILGEVDALDSYTPQKCFR